MTGLKANVARRTVLGAGGAAGAFIWLGGVARASDTPVVTTEHGKVAGFCERGVLTFKGIPYGDTPAGRARFMAPRKAQPWVGVRNCTDYGPTAPPMAVWFEAPPFVDDLRGGMAPPYPPASSEDCLNLNVWTPAASDGRKRPVLVWLHGGGFFTGNTTDVRTNGANLAKIGDVVVVSVHHRLNVLGYLDLSTIGGPRYKESGQAGMLDLVLALEWVKANIAEFGGDPGNVTIFGQSGGGQKVCNLMAMPAAKGLFHKAIIQSGVGIKALSKELGAKLATDFLQEVGVSASQLDKLEEMPFEHLIQATFELAKRYPRYPEISMGEVIGFQPVMDGEIISHHPFYPGASPLAEGVPLMIGSTLTEASVFSTGEKFEMTERGFLEEAERLGGGSAGARKLAQMYNAEWPDMKPHERFFIMASDRDTYVPSTVIAERQARNGAKVFLYRFDWMTPVSGGRLMAPHGIEVPFVFNNVRNPAVSPIIGDDPRSFFLSDVMAKAWATFAWNGDPNHDALPQWPAYSEGNRSTLVFGKTTNVRRNLSEDARKFFSQVSPGGWLMPPRTASESAIPDRRE